MGQDHQPTTRVRKVDWRRVAALLDEQPIGTPVLVAELDQSVRTHIKEGRYEAINPDKYDVWTEAVDGSRTLARIYMARRR